MVSLNCHSKIRAELSTEPLDYSSAKEQATRLDEQFGFKCKIIEEKLFNQLQPPANNFENPQEFWIGLDIQSLQTPYSEIVEMINFLNPNPGDLWLDLGAAYGRMGLILGLLRPMVQFTGYEFIQQRVDEGNRVLKLWKCHLSEIKQADISSDDFELERSDLYFLYDFGSKKAVYRILEKLRTIAAKRPIRVIARGRGVRNWLMVDFPWISQVHQPQHFKNWSLFCS